MKVEVGMEMNMHVPQSIQTHEELAQLAAVPTQIISPREAKPIVSIVQDIALGVYRMTKSHVRVSEKQLHNLLSTNPKFLGVPSAPGEVVNGVKYWTGRQLLSSILPNVINLRTANNSFDDRLTNNKENYVIIEGGEIMQGVIDKDIYQARSKGLVHTVYNECGPNETRLLFDNTQRLVCDWLVYNGFSVGISDLVVDDTRKQQFHEIIHNMKIQVYDIMRDLHLGKFENNSTKNNAEAFEMKVNSILNKANDEVGRLGLSQINDVTNRMLNMVKSGSKGNKINVAQMIGCLGQQNVDGQRIPYGFDDRTLPHYTKYDDGPQSRGFVENSFIKGLTPQEFFFHAMGGREGLIDTAVKSVTGDTPIVVLEDGVCKHVTIGDWIDGHLKERKDDVAHFEERQMEYLYLNKDSFIPTTDEKGHVTWGQITAVTRHDPGTELYQIKTAGGKSVIVTESKSLLTWHEDLGMFKEVPTPEIKVGDCLPVTANLVTPPVVTRSVSMGHDNAVFELSHDNGVFIGLFLANGDACADSGSVNIANADHDVTQFVKQWFDKHKEEEEEHATLAQFLNAFVGCPKVVPDVAFVAPDAFIVGLLSGYFSGSGVVDKDSAVVESGSASERLTNGIAMLCTRLGIFGEVSSVTKDAQHRFAIRAQWAKAFAEKVDLLVESKNTQLKAIQCSTEHRNFKAMNDVVLDAIVDIQILDTAKYPKVYDLTIPSTLNFGLANGLQVRDTSDTGYIQRKLVKAMEDCKVNYDLTVRNASGSIVQFLYGEDGMDGTKIESQPLPIIDMDLNTLRQEYLVSHDVSEFEGILTDELYQQLVKAGSAFTDRTDAHFQQVLQDREFLIHEVFRDKQSSSVMYPVAFLRIIAHVQQTYAKFSAQPTSDLDPRYVLDVLDMMEKKLSVNSFMRDSSRLMHILMRMHLSPKKLLIKHRFNRDAFDFVIQQIQTRFYDSLAHPSEMVGVIAAQSIGEPTTQLSIDKSSTILISTPNGGMYRGRVGDFIDHLLKKNTSRVINLGHDSVVMDLTEDYKIIGVSDNETTSWKRISQISRHPANGGMVRIHTRSGKTHCATLSHSFLKRTEKGIAPVLGSELKVGDRVPVAKHIDPIAKALTEIKIGASMRMTLDREFGWFIGAYLADGCLNGNRIFITKIIPEFYEKVTQIVKDRFQCDAVQVRREPHTIKYSKDPNKLYEGITTQFNCPALARYLKAHFGTGAYNKTIPGFVFQSNPDFIAGVLGGYFDGDGNVNSMIGKQMIRSCSVSEQLTEDIILLLAYHDIFASKCVEVRKEEERGNLHTVQISRKYARQFKERIGLHVHKKAQALEEIIAYVDREDKHSMREDIDRIPALGQVIASIGERLALPGQSRLYKRWLKKEAVGRSTLLKYIDLFEEANALAQLKDVTEKIAILKQAANSDVVWDEIVRLEHLDDPKEFVYDFTVPGNDSFMVDCGVLVHNTLNSVEYSTSILLSVDGELVRTSIGEFIDNEITHAKAESLEQHPNDTKLAWTKHKNIKILSCDENGQVSWKEVEAVTQHPPINEDGSHTLVRVVCESGREVTATKAKSFLKRVNNKIVHTRGDELRVGDYLPVSTILPVEEVATKVECLDVSKFLPKTDWLYMSEVEKAKEVAREDGTRHWFSHQQGKRFTVPYSRSDKPGKRQVNDVHAGCVYPKRSIYQSAHIPEAIPLDSLFGFFIGAYLAEGCCTKHHVLIANIDDTFNEQIDTFCQMYSIKYHIDDVQKNGGRSKTLRLHSYVLAQLMQTMCGRVSHEKRFPAHLLAAPKEFLRAVVSGYISGEGCSVTASSVSYGLLEDMQQILVRFGIRSSIKAQHAQLQHALRNGLNARLPYELRVGACHVKTFQQEFTLKIPRKQQRLDA
ncbi:MAG: LAGLIDADG family homing endonuclease, partial [Synechococcus sp.]|nr:LAGLIDADG family homing endonuclease [Synechococcus sp.]